MIKKLPLFFLFLLALTTVSQERRILISGKVSDSLGVVKNATVINLKTDQGTFSSDDGSFRIFVSKGDSLRFSSVQHITKKIIIGKKIIENKSITILLNSNTYVLDEFDLKRHNLTGRLGIDVKDVKNDKKDSLLRETMDFSNINFKQKDQTIDEIERVRPPVVNTMAGAMPMAGSGAGASIPFKYSERLWALRKKLARKKAFPFKVLSELGEKFFFEKLKIPVENYFHFLEYCNPLGIEDLHKENRLLELIKVFEKESISYLKIIKKD